MTCFYRMQLDHAIITISILNFTIIMRVISSKFEIQEFISPSKK